jgi:hypothetical protein
VGCGLLAVHDAVVESARRVNPQLFGWDDQDGIEVLIDPAWQQTSHAAKAAALGSRERLRVVGELQCGFDAAWSRAGVGGEAQPAIIEHLSYQVLPAWIERVVGHFRAAFLEVTRPVSRVCSMRQKVVTA